jgi:uncharacterized zinc-type alcohol dehydrogenase-like protein
MVPTKGYAAHGAHEPLKPFSFDRRDPQPRDVQIEILFCGVCHSDLHIVRNEWGRTIYPCVPGHEIVGRVVKVGREVRKFKEGDLAAVGCMVDSDRVCPNCRAGLEQFCDQGVTLTYNSEDKHTGGVTYGGYSKSTVVDQDFVLRVPDKLDPAAAGADVTLFTTSAGKVADAKRLGAHEVVISKDEAAMEKQQKRFDFIIDTVSAAHDLSAYLSLLKRDGALVLVGIPPEAVPLNVFHLVSPRRQLAGSLIGGIAETQEMLDFCAERGIACDIEMIAIDKINEAYERMLKSDVKYRFVIDMASLA